jgi:hypothetical protein
VTPSSGRQFSEALLHLDCVRGGHLFKDIANIRISSVRPFQILEPSIPCREFFRCGSTAELDCQISPFVVAQKEYWLMLPNFRELHRILSEIAAMVI